MKLKYMSKLLAFSILISNLNISSFAGALSEDGRHETFEGKSITIDNILEEDTVDVEIEGNTMVNLVDYKNILPIGSAKTNTFTKNNNFYELTISEQGSMFVSIPTIYDISSKNITIIIENNSTFDIFLWSRKNYIPLKSLQEGRNIITGNYSDISQGFGIGYTGDKSIDNVLKFSIQIFEGDLTSNAPTEYFEGMQSSFENNLITQEMINNGQEKAENLGKYRVEVKSTGKNKFDGIDHNKDFEFSINSEGILSASDITTDTRPWNYDNCQYYIKLAKGTYTITLDMLTPSTSSYAQIRAYLPNASSSLFYFGQSQVSVAGIYTKTFTLDYDVALGVEAKFYDGTCKMQIEEGSVATEYEPYRESINTFYLNSPLLEGDTIECINGQPTHVKRYKKTILDGSDDEDWFYYGDGLEDRNGTAIFANRDFVDRLENSTIICDEFKTGYKNITNYDKFGDTESLWGHNLSIHKNHLYFRIKTSRLSSIDLKGFKQWLNNNSVTVVYELSEPIYEPINADLSVNLFNGAAHISNNSNIPANMKITVDRVANRAQEAVELAKTTPTVENLSQARYWTNLLKESTLKDSFQEQVDNILELEDLTIEKKTTSVNADVYIKMKNTLSLSLDTNSIVFDEVDATEDTEMQNAVNLTIGSSLPYRVNAYLEDEIYNADKSEILDKSILNIRANGKSLYQAFADLSSPIMLLDDQEAGVDNIHGIDLRLASNDTNKADIYKTVIKFEVEQK